MAKVMTVTLTKRSTYTDMSTGKVWRKGVPETMGEASAARFQTNPQFAVNEVQAKPKSKPVPEAAPEPAPKTAKADGGDEPKPKAKTKGKAKA